MPFSELLVLGLVALLSFGLSYLGASVGLVFGQLRLPILVYWLGSPAVGAATSLAISAVAALVGAARHARAGRVDVRLLLTIGVPSALAAWLATRVAVKLDPALVKLCIGGTLALTGGMMLRSKGRPTRAPVEGMEGPEAPPPGPQVTSGSAPVIVSAPAHAPSSASTSGPELDDRSAPRGHLVLEVIVGVALGAVAGIVGLLLGTLRLPAMLKLGAHPARAIGTNMAIGSMTGIIAGTAALLEGNVDPWAFGVITPATMVGAYLGASTTGRLDKATLRRLIALSLLGIGAWMAAEPWW